MPSFRSLAFLLAFTAQAFPAGAVTFTSDTLIGVTNTAFEGVDIVVTNATLTVDGPHTFASIQLLYGATLTHSYSPNGLLEGSLSVTNEPQLLSSTNPVTLDNSNVDASTILVTDSTGLTNYTDGVDYVVGSDSTGLLTTLARTVNSSIPDGATVNVSYSADTAHVPTGLNLAILGDVQVDPGAAVNASATGYGPGFGGGAGATLLTNYPYYFYSGGGGGYGGFGGSSSALAHGGAGRGSATNSFSIGSGGGAGSGPGGTGGGAIQLVVGGTLRLDGQMSANGGTGTNPFAGGGSGGGIWFSAQTFSGAGAISANGGSGDLPDGGGGGGGRIAYYCVSNQFTGTLSALGGAGANYGGAGTIFSSTSGTNAQLLVDNGGWSGTNTFLSDAGVFDLTVSGGAILQPVAGLALNNLLVRSNSWLANLSGSLLSMTVYSNAEIDAGGGFFCDAKGYGPGSGTGAGRIGELGTTTCGSGGGYGGSGGPGATGVSGGISYGFINSSPSVGSGGGNGIGAGSGGGGGGGVSLTVDGALQFNGVISANGGAASGSGGGGGSGGGIALTIGKLSGAGSISANGGSGDLPFGGGGGGGRIMLTCSTNNYTGTMQAYGGVGGQNGSAGTIYTKSNTPPAVARVIIDNGGSFAPSNTLLSLTFPSDLTITGNAAAVLVPQELEFTLGNLLIESNCWLSTPPLNEVDGIDLVVTNNATILQGGGILLNGLGYASGTGTGAGKLGGGGGYGGFGGLGNTNGYGGASYGNPFALEAEVPSVGSGGGASSTDGAGGAGGGALLFRVGHTLALNGSILANGTASPTSGAGGGSGGAVMLTANLFTGSGSISANGGSGGSLGGGGGGRIIVSYNTNQFTGVLSAQGGSGFNYGGAGTVAYQMPVPSSQPNPGPYPLPALPIGVSPLGSLVVDNGGQSGTNTPVALGGFSARYNVTISGGAKALYALSSPIFEGDSILSNLVVGSNSWLLFSNSTTQATLSCSNATVQAGGVLTLDGSGYAAGSGPGEGLTASTSTGLITGGGGGYAGYGGPSFYGASGGGYSGSFNLPETPGSGGGNGTGPSPFNLGGSGGGALQFTVANTLRVDGRLSANGTTGPGQGSGGGSGGSLALTVGTVSGAGIISANGGSGDLPYGGGGSGGRIALTCTSNLFTGSITAYGGAGASNGAAGTVYVSPHNLSTSSLAQLVLDNGGMTGMTTPLSLSSSLVNVTVSGGAAPFVPAMSGYTVLVANLLINSNSSLVVTSSASTFASASSVTVRAGGVLSLDGMGYSSYGQGEGSSSGGSPNPVSGGGGGYGGPGGASRFGIAGGVSYGSMTQPSYPGSPGGNGYGSIPTNSAGGAGGGALELTVTGPLQVDGRLSANGITGPGQGSGGGAGGSLWLTASNLAGAGIISANGGAGDLPYGGGGGGGRIAIYCATNLFSGPISAHGGAGAFYGAAGTVYLQSTIGTAPAQVIIDNGGWAPVSNTAVSLSSTSDLTISGGALVNASVSQIHNLLIASNSWLALGSASASPQTVTVTANATIQPGAGIIMDGLGNTSGSGPGAGQTINTLPSYVSGGGGGYGGFGGPSFYGAGGGSSYGGTLEALYQGSGGGAGNGGSYTSPGGAGGGALSLTVEGTLALNGQISANGTAGKSGGAGGGAGGSLLLTVGAISGAGVISANGGSGNLPYGGGGGGGRIAVTYVTNQFTGAIMARGGAGSTYGGAGTVYLVPPSQNIGALPLPGTSGLPQLLVDNGGQRGAGTPLNLQFPYYIDLIVSGGAVASPANDMNLDSILVASNAWLSPYTNQTGSIELNVRNNVTVQAGGGIVFDGTGYRIDAGSASGRTSSNYGYAGSGGGNGGCGGASQGGLPGGTGALGSIQIPDLLGSGGGGEFTGNFPSGSAGGGALELFVSGTLRVDGILSANGTGPTTQGSGGGAGGSLWLSATTLAGAGQISADGGPGDPGQGGGGGGGRIAIDYATNLFTGPITAYGGDGFMVGGAGTIYSKAHTNLIGQLLIDNGGLLGTNTPVNANEAFYLTISGAAVVSPSANPMVLTSLSVDSNAVLTYLAPQTNLDVIVLSNAVIGSKGLVLADNLGYGGLSPGPGEGQTTNSYSGSGGGYGGAGGASITGIPGGITYGSAYEPVDPGSGGGLFPVINNFCQGGGVLRFEVADTLTVNGRLTANGNAALIEGAGGGAGGSIWITARKLAGSGLICASGGPGDPVLGGGGGGGRIAIWSPTNAFTGPMLAMGGGGANPGQPGSIVLTNIPAPQVIAQSPDGIVYSTVSYVNFTFDHPMYPGAVSASGFSLETPDGLLSQDQFGTATPDVHTIQVSFPAQDTLGYYQVQAGPQFQDIYGLPMSAPYVGSFVILPPVISGQVTDTNGVGVPYVTLNISGETVPLLTDSSGNYSLDVFPSWSGTITPARAGEVFIPTARIYTNVSANLTNQNFIVSAPAVLAMSMAIGSQNQDASCNLAWYGLNGVSYQPLCSTNLIDWQPCSNPIVGTNGPMNLAFPIGTAPVMFFRFSTSY